MAFVLLFVVSYCFLCRDNESMKEFLEHNRLVVAINYNVHAIITVLRLLFER